MNFLGTSREKAFLHEAFSRYLSPLVINEIIADPSKLNLGGEKREMTAIFTDIEGFSTIAEKMDPSQLVRLLNRYLTLMSNIIMENLGTIDKYEGDAIIAFFGAPVHREDHAILACRSALAIKQAEAELNVTIKNEGLSPAPLFTRIGINTGEMVVGNMGADKKMDYTIMGNAVNLASRLEGVNKLFQTGILISEFTRKQIDAGFFCRKLDRARVKGIDVPVRLYELKGFWSETPEDEREAGAVWEQALALMEERRFKEAGTLFASLAARGCRDQTAEFYEKRCAAFLDTPPPKGWDGVNIITEK
jgi:adenylate cyclase